MTKKKVSQIVSSHSSFTIAVAHLDMAMNFFDILQHEMMVLHQGRQDTSSLASLVAFW